MARVRPILLPIVAIVLVAPWVPAEESSSTVLDIEELVRRADPMRDDWATETLERAAAAQLESLSGLLADGPAALEGIARADARSTPLRPARLTLHRIAGGTTVARLETPPPEKPSEPLSTALSDLVEPFRRAASVQIHFKIVGIESSENGRFGTRVRYEGAARIGDAAIEQTANWWVDWSFASGNGSPTIAGVRLESFEELSTPARWFEDVTLDLIPVDVWSERLAFGGNYWHGRIDSVGESNLMGHNGIAIGDVNGDGLEDVYVALGTGLPNMLFVQNADGTVREVADEAGVAWLDDTKGVLFADMDNDGDQDLLCAIGPTIVLAHNDGHGKFGRFISMRAPTPAAFYSLSVADYDLDGDLDLYGARYVVERYGISVPMPFHDANNGPTNHLMRNDGEGEFTDVTIASGLGVNNQRFSLIGAWGDYDGDGDPDLYVANDFGRNNLYRNDGGKFVDVAAEAGVEDQAAGMGVSWSDYDLDGDLDLYVTNMFSAAGNRIAYQPRFQADRDETVRRGIRNHASGNTLLDNQGNGTFRDVTDAAGVRMGRWGWGARFADLNNDGFDDIIVPNGFLTGVVEDDL